MMKSQDEVKDKVQIKMAQLLDHAIFKDKYVNTYSAEIFFALVLTW